MNTYRYVDHDGDRLEIRPGNEGIIKLDSIDAATGHRVIIAVPVERTEELIAAVRAAAQADRPA